MLGVGAWLVTRTYIVPQPSLYGLTPTSYCSRKALRTLPYMQEYTQQLRRYREEWEKIISKQRRLLETRRREMAEKDLRDRQDLISFLREILNRICAFRMDLN